MCYQHRLVERPSYVIVSGKYHKSYAFLANGKYLVALSWAHTRNSVSDLDMRMSRGEPVTPTLAT